MKVQSCLREYLRYTTLSVLGTLGVSCYILADTFFVSAGLGTRGLAALNLAIPVYNFIHGTGLMLGMGGATKFSVVKSQKKQEQVDLIYMNTLYLALAFSVLFLVMGALFSRQIAIVLGADSQVLGMTVTYLRWLFLFSPAFIFNDVLLCFVRNDGSPQLSMIAMLVGSFSNIVLDYIFIFPMKMGIFGAVFATGLSPVISMILMMPHWLKKKNTFRFGRKRISRNVIGQDLALGAPSLIAQMSTGISMITFNILILRLEGNVGVAAYGVIANISLVILAVYTGISQGIQPLLCGFYGENNRRKIKQVMRYARVTVVVLSLILYAVIFEMADPITHVFNSENNMELQKIAVTGLKIYFLSNLFVGYNTILSVFFTSVERALPAQILSLLRGLVLMIPMVFLLSYLWKMPGIWLSYPLTEMVVSVLGGFLCRHYNRM